MDSGAVQFSRLRQQAGLGFDELAAKTGYSVGTLHHWDRGDKTPCKDALRLLENIIRDAGQKPPAKATFTFVDLFAGIGGMRRGFEYVGGKCVFTSEWNRFARQTYSANFECDHEVAGDITAIPVESIPEHDVLLAGFPCQPFSIAGVSKKNVRIPDEVCH